MEEDFFVSFWEMIFFFAVAGIILMLIFIPMGASGMLGDKKKRGVRDLSDSRAASAPLSAARRFAMLHRYEIVQPAHIVSNGKSADLDFLIVGCFGVLGVKCVGLGGTIYGDANEREWTQMSGGERKAFANPIDEAAAATRVVRDVLFSAKRKNVPVETVCVFTNQKAELALPRGTGHYTLKEFRALLDKEKYLYDKGVDEKAVAELLRGAVK